MRVMLPGWGVPALCRLFSALGASLLALLFGGGEGRSSCALLSCRLLLVTDECFACDGCVSDSGSMEGEGEGGAEKLWGGRDCV